MTDKFAGPGSSRPEAVCSTGTQGSTPGPAQPDIFDLIAELRRTLDLFDGAMPVTPKQAWDEAIAVVEQMKAGRCWKCMKQDASR